jgi:hypothetical protein
MKVHLRVVRPEIVYKLAHHAQYLVLLEVQVQPVAFRSFNKGDNNLCRLHHNLTLLRNYFLVQLWYGTPVIFAINIMKLYVHRHWLKSSLHLFLLDTLKEDINLEIQQQNSIKTSAHDMYECSALSLK